MSWLVAVRGRLWGLRRVATLPFGRARRRFELPGTLAPRCRMPTSDSTQSPHRGHRRFPPRRGRPAPGPRDEARCERALNVLYSVYCVPTQESAWSPNNNAVDGNALLRFYRQQNVLMYWYNRGLSCRIIRTFLTMVVFVCSWLACCCQHRVFFPDRAVIGGCRQAARGCNGQGPGQGRSGERPAAVQIRTSLPRDGRRRCDDARGTDQVRFRLELRFRLGEREAL